MASLPEFESRRRPPRVSPPTKPETGNNDDRALRTAREMVSYRALVDRTVDVFGDEIKASRWLSMPNRDFGGQTPLQVAQEGGYDLAAIEPILIRIEHGVEF